MWCLCTTAWVQDLVTQPIYLISFPESSDHVVSLFIVGKRAILVVMHHTYNPQHVVAKSRSQVNNSNVHLTVDCLFYEDQLLDCDLNNTMWNDIRRTLRSPNHQVRISLTDLLMGIHAITDVCGLVFSIKVLLLFFFFFLSSRPHHCKASKIVRETLTFIQLP